MDKKIVVMVLITALLMPLSFLAQASNLTVSENNFQNNPPNPPEIDGPRSGESTEEIFYSFKTTDPDNNMLMTLEIDWGDGEIQREGGESCTMPWESGKVIEISHVWNETGDYSITARAQDINGAWSNWSEPLEVSMPKSKNNYQNLIEYFFQKLSSFKFLDGIF